MGEGGQRFRYFWRFADRPCGELSRGRQLAGASDDRGRVDEPRRARPSREAGRRRGVPAGSHLANARRGNSRTRASKPARRRAEGPDVAVIKAELAARRRQHQDALHGYLGATEMGLPWFGQGVSYLANRLRRYEKIMDRRGLEFSNLDPEKITSALRQIESFSASCDYSATVTTYSGPHPARPGLASLTRTDFLATKGFPISP